MILFIEYIIFSIGAMVIAVAISAAAFAVAAVVVLGIMKILNYKD